MFICTRAIVFLAVFWHYCLAADLACYRTSTATTSSSGRTTASVGRRCPAFANNGPRPDIRLRTSSVDHLVSAHKLPILFRFQSSSSSPTKDSCFPSTGLLAIRLLLIQSRSSPVGWVLVLGTCTWPGRCAGRCRGAAHGPPTRRWGSAPTRSAERPHPIPALQPSTVRPSG